MYEIIDLVFDAGTRKSNLTNIIIGKLESMNRPDLVIKFGSWYRSKLTNQKIDKTHAKTILLALSHAYFLQGNFEKRKEIELEVQSLRTDQYHGLTELLLEQQLVNTDFYLGYWQKSTVKLKKIYGKLECIYRDPAKLQVGFEHESYEDKHKIIKNIASLGMQETLQTASMVYDVLGRADKAIDCLRKAVKLSEEVNGKRHIFTASLNQDLADLYLKKGELEKARKLTASVLAVRKKFLPSYSISSANSYMSLGKVYTELKEFEKAKFHLDKAMKNYNRMDKLGGLINMPLLTEAYAKLAFATGEYEECLKLVSKAISQYNHYFLVDFPVVVDALDLKIACLKALNKYEEANCVVSKRTNILIKYKMDSDRING